MSKHFLGISLLSNFKFEDYSGFILLYFVLFLGNISRQIISRSLLTRLVFFIEFYVPKNERATLNKDRIIRKEG